MTDIVTGIGGVTANGESYSTHQYELFYEPIFNDSFGEPIEEEYRPMSQFAGENGVPYQFRIRTEDKKHHIFWQESHLVILPRIPLHFVGNINISPCRFQRKNTWKPQGWRL